LRGWHLTTRGQWINPLVFSLAAVEKRLPALKRVKSPIYIVGMGRRVLVRQGDQVILLSVFSLWAISFVRNDRARVSRRFGPLKLVGGCMDNEKFLSIERKFHDEYAATLNWNEDITEYLSYGDEELSAVEKSFLSMLGTVDGKRILDIGSGHGNCALNLSKRGAKVTSIDISPQIIKGCAYRAHRLNLAVDFRVMNAEDLQFHNNEFDLVVGFRTIHHLPNIKRFYLEAFRVLKNSGALVLVEPQKYNPFVEFGRRFIKPKDRTITEHPLVPADIKLARDLFGNIETKYFIFLSTLSLFFRDIIRVKPFYKISSFVLGLFDKAILIIFPFCKPLYWQVVMKCLKKSNIRS
jgi:ubiquinone/menaquinone biosynthesis C-methylase UbiE